MPNQVDDALLHAMYEYELSRVRTEFNQLRILPIVSPHPVQPNGKFSGHGHFGNSFLPAYHQVQILTPPILVTPGTGVWTSSLAFEPNSTNCEYCQWFRHIQYNRTPSFLAMATLAILFSPRIIRCRYLRRQSGLHRAAACVRAFPRSNRIQPTANIANCFATSSTTERQVFWPWPLWQFFFAGVSSGADTYAANLGYTGHRRVDELSRVRTEFNQLRILPIVSPHPVQPNGKFSGHGHFGNSFLPAYHQVQILTPPILVTPGTGVWTSSLAFEPNSTNCEYCQLFRHIQYNRTASFLAMATLAILFSRRIIRCAYRRRQSGLHRAAACDASTNKKRSRVLPCLLMCPSRCLPALESSHGMSPV